MKKISLFMLVPQKWVGFKRKIQFIYAKKYTEKNTPELMNAYRFFTEYQQSGTPRQPFKGWDLWSILELAKPRSIVELGSGTAVFSLWAKRNKARFVSFEHHNGWAETTQKCLKSSKIIGPKEKVVVHSDVEILDSPLSIGFKEDVPFKCDFVYIDGPPCVLENGVKVPNNDCYRLLENGDLPNTIVVDGRVETVGLLKKHPIIKEYDFYPSFVYYLIKKLFFSAFRGREHSVFSLKQ